MKNFILNIVLIAFTSGQVLAYAPTSDSQELTRAVNQITEILDSSTKNEFKKASNSKPMSLRKFKRKKRKFLKELNKKALRIEGLSLQEEKIFLKKENATSFKKSRAVTSKILKRKRLMAKLARKTGVKANVLESQLTRSTSKTTEKEVLKNKLAKIKDTGSYYQVIMNQIDRLDSISYRDYLNGINKMINPYKRTPSSKTPGFKSDDVDEWALLFFFAAGIILMMIATAVLLVIITIILIAGGSIAPLILPAAIGTGLSLFVLVAIGAE